MAWRCGGSLSRSIFSSSRASTLRSPPSPPRFSAPPRLQSHRRLSFIVYRNLGELGCVMSLLPLYGAVDVRCMASHLSVGPRACCELSHGGTFCRACQDR